MTHTCKGCGLEFDDRNLHDTHWKKCVKTVTFVIHTGEQVTVTHHQNGTFLCYCSHPKCPKEKGFVTVDALQKHMKTLKTTWLGPEKKASAEGRAESSGQTPALEIDIGNPQMSAGTTHTPKYGIMPPVCKHLKYSIGLNGEYPLHTSPIHPITTLQGADLCESDLIFEQLVRVGFMGQGLELCAELCDIQGMAQNVISNPNLA
ncbi:hypothetical protein EDC04DRAFT_3090911 [Pisolithus marmoratus]|nr:hypothetical protein EDC04DRAFT_3090911 [Pisolithus marmoratus]